MQKTNYICDTAFNRPSFRPLALNVRCIYLYNRKCYTISICILTKRQRMIIYIIYITQVCTYILPRANFTQRRHTANPFIIRLQQQVGRRLPTTVEDVAKERAFSFPLRRKLNQYNAGDKYSNGQIFCKMRFF